MDQSDLGPSVNANTGNQTNLGDFLTPIPFLGLLLNEEVNSYCREERDTSPSLGAGYPRRWVSDRRQDAAEEAGFLMCPHSVLSAVFWSASSMIYSCQQFFGKN